MNFPKHITGTSKSKLPHRSEGADVPQALNKSGAVNASPFLAEPSNLTGEAGAPRTLPTKPDCASCGRGETALIPLSQGQFAIVDASDFEELSKHNWFTQRSFSSHGGFYAWRNVIGQRGKRVWMHRQIMGPPDDLTVDHINRNGLDNRRSNLRLATKQEQMANRKVPNSKFVRSMGLRGVKRIPSKLPNGKPTWHSQIVIGGKHIFGPVRSDPVEAAVDYDRAAKQTFGEFATLNFPCRFKDDEEHGSRPRCPKCGRGHYGCICGCPEPEQECFRPALNRDPDLHAQAMQSREAY